MTEESQPAYLCQECGAISENCAGALYECGECSGRFNIDDHGNHRCEDCGKFASKVAPESCEECGEGEVEEIEAYECPSCSTLYQDAEEAVKCCAAV